MARKHAEPVSEQPHAALTPEIASAMPHEALAGWFTRMAASERQLAEIWRVHAVNARDTQFADLCDRRAEDCERVAAEFEQARVV